MDPQTHYKVCPRCQTPCNLQAASCHECGRVFQSTAPLPPPRDDRTIVYPSSEGPIRQYQPPPPPQQVLPPAYQQPVYYEPPQAQKTDVCAILAVTIGGVGLLICGAALGPAALILGVVSLFRIKENPGLKGQVLAIVGLALGGLATLYASIMLAIALR